MTRTVYIIRHGQTVGSHERRYKGSLDVALSEEGRAQVERTAVYMKDAGLVPDVVYCSTLQRARVSAEIVCSRFGLAPVEEHGLRERHFGQWEGMSFDEIAAKWPDAFSAWAGNPLMYSPMGGESTQQVHDRLMPVVDALICGPHERVAIVAHGGVNRIMLCKWMGIPLENVFRVEQDFACLNVVKFYDSLPVVSLLNYSPRGA